MPILKTGCLAYLDTMSSGLVPCKIVRVETDKRQDGKIVAHVVARITATRGVYSPGLLVDSEDCGRIVPRDAVRRFRGQIFPRILPFVVQHDGPMRDQS